MFSLRSHADHSRAEPSRPGRLLRRSSALVAVAALAISACGSGDDSVSPDADVEQADDAQEPEAATTESADDAAGDSGDSGDESGEVVDADPAALQETGPVAVEGSPLDPFDSTLEDLSIGAAAPVVRGQSFDGSEVVIGAPTDNPTMVVFLAHWCPHCNDEVPVLLDLAATGGLPDGLDIVGVSTAVVADRDNFPPSQWVVDKGWTFPTMADDENQSAIAAFGGTGFPFTVVLDTDGTVLARRSGQAPADEIVAFAEAALATATA